MTDTGERRPEPLEASDSDLAAMQATPQVLAERERRATTTITSEQAILAVNGPDRGRERPEIAGGVPVITAPSQREPGIAGMVATATTTTATTSGTGLRVEGVATAVTGMVRNVHVPPLGVDDAEPWRRLAEANAQALLAADETRRQESLAADAKAPAARAEAAVAPAPTPAARPRAAQVEQRIRVGRLMTELAIALGLAKGIGMPTIRQLLRGPTAARPTGVAGGLSGPAAPRRARP